MITSELNNKIIVITIILLLSNALRCLLLDGNGLRLCEGVFVCLKRDNGRNYRPVDVTFSGYTLGIYTRVYIGL